MTTIAIPLSKRGRKHAGKYQAIVDSVDSDLELLDWQVNVINSDLIYASRPISPYPKRQFMHRVILARKLGRELLPTEYVDHIDGNGLNNTWDNLRLATHTQNMQNRRMWKKKTGYKGVYWNKIDKVYQSSIKANGIVIYLGRFKTAEDAHKAYCEASEKYHGEYGNK